MMSYTPFIGPLSNDEKALLIFLKNNGGYLQSYGGYSQMYDDKPSNLSVPNYTNMLARQMVSRKFDANADNLSLVEIRDDGSIVLLEEGRLYAQI